MRASRLALAGVALALAVTLALLAADARAWDETFRADDARFSLDERPPPTWDTSTILPSGISRGMVSVGDDRALRRAVASFRAAHEARGAFVRPRRRGEAEAALAAVAAGADRTQASQASNLLGVLAFSDATSGRRATPVERSLGAFQTAVRLDPGNAAAKYNLELLLRLLEAREERTGPNPAPGPRGSGRRGAGAATPGQGY